MLLRWCRLQHDPDQVTNSQARRGTEAGQARGFGAWLVPLADLGRDSTDDLLRCVVLHPVTADLPETGPCNARRGNDALCARPGSGLLIQLWLSPVRCPSVDHWWLPDATTWPVAICSVRSLRT